MRHKVRHGGHTQVSAPPSLERAGPRPRSGRRATCQYGAGRARERQGGRGEGLARGQVLGCTQSCLPTKEPQDTPRILLGYSCGYSSVTPVVTPRILLWLLLGYSCGYSSLGSTPKAFASSHTHALPMPRAPHAHAGAPHTWRRARRAGSKRRAWGEGGEGEGRAQPLGVWTYKTLPPLHPTLPGASPRARGA